MNLFTQAVHCALVLRINGKENVLSSEGLKYLLLAETGYRSNRVCNQSWNGEIDVSIFGGMLGMCIPLAISLLLWYLTQQITAKLLNAVL